MNDRTTTQSPTRGGQQQKPRQIERRTVTRTVAWSVPVIAASAAAPAFAASCFSDLSTVSLPGANGPNEAPNSTVNGQPAYLGPRYLTFTATYTNNGPQVQPAGWTIRLDLAFSGYWDDPSIAANPNGLSLTGPTRTEGPTETLGSGTDFNRAQFAWIVNTPLAVGQTVTVTYRARLRGRPAFGPTYSTFTGIALRARSTVIAGPTCQDTVAPNSSIVDPLFTIDNRLQFTG